MKNCIIRWAKILSASALSLILLDSGQTSAAGFPSPACRPNFRLVGSALCIDIFPQAAAQFDTAMLRCRSRGSYVASYGDLYYLYSFTLLDVSYNPFGRWIGPDLSADDQALCGGRDITVDADPDQENFENTCNKDDLRTYWCAHDFE